MPHNNVVHITKVIIAAPKEDQIFKSGGDGEGSENEEDEDEDEDGDKDDEDENFMDEKSEPGDVNEKTLEGNEGEMETIEKLGEGNEEEMEINEDQTSSENDVVAEGSQLTDKKVIKSKKSESDDGAVRTKLKNKSKKPKKNKSVLGDKV